MFIFINFVLLFVVVYGDSVPACSAPVARLNDGHLMPRFGFGTWLGLDKYQLPVPVDGEAVQLAVLAAIDAGYRHIDTASIYDDEDQVGRAVNQKIADGAVKREDMFITTKLWNDRHASAAVVAALQESLQRLNLTYVDLFLIHWPFATETKNIRPYADIDYLETWRGMVEAKRLGLASSIGVCNFNLTQLRRLWDSHELKPAVLQVETNLNQQQPELRQFCHSRGVQVVGYTPFGSLFPDRAAPDAPPPRADDPQLLAIADRHNKTVPQVVLRYLFELGVTPIPKSVTKSRIEQNRDIFDFSLDEFDRQQLRSYHTGHRVVDLKIFSDANHYPF
ncbi:aldo-keto reductase AKR2E4 isoform X2 [Bicyclus anynana]|uniref:Aldo-keto reductase AKR2E4 isoform X2 n=1 Tax=Bicyclus anynana TaxID=110368 RepID=A0A6J1MIQ2_BICAN|nr:aldo-keto reductase AKR2E4 isoform X2 [Bicyclus anynana]